MRTGWSSIGHRPFCVWEWTKRMGHRDRWENTSHRLFGPEAEVAVDERDAWCSVSMPAMLREGSSETEPPRCNVSNDASVDGQGSTERASACCPPELRAPGPSARSCALPLLTSLHYLPSSLRNFSSSCFPLFIFLRHLLLSATSLFRAASRASSYAKDDELEDEG